MSDAGRIDGDSTSEQTPEETPAQAQPPVDADSTEQLARARHAHADDGREAAPDDDVERAEQQPADSQPVTWSATSAAQDDTPPYGTPTPPQQTAQPRYQYEPPRYEAPNYPPPIYETQQPYAPPFQPLAPSTPPRGRQQQQPAQHHAPESGGYPAQPPYAVAESLQQHQPQQHQPQQYQPPPPHSPPPMPRPEDLLEPNQSPVTIESASQGWRGRLNRGSFGLVKPKPGPEEVALRRAIVGIQRSFSRPMTVVVVQPKGGAGKTPTTICLSAAFGAHRGGYVVGWDDNETRGTLAVRVANPDDTRATVWDLLSDLAAFERFDARVGDLSYYVRAQPDAHFDALVSDDNPANMAQIGEDEFHRLHRVLERFYRMIVVDTGNNVRSPNWQAAVNAADLVVVVSTYQRDAGYSGSWVLDHLAQTGREKLARNAITVLTAADPTTDKTVRAQLIEHFSARTRAVAEIPYDQQLAHGGPIRWIDLSPRTRNAWILAGATIVDALVEHDQQALAARRA